MDNVPAADGKIRRCVCHQPETSTICRARLLSKRTPMNK
jgi:hypothetical protein